MRSLLGCMLVVVIGGWLGAEDKKVEKVDAQKLIGKWTYEMGKEFRSELEFSKDNKVTMSTTIDGEIIKYEGTYKIDGAKIEFTVKENGKEEMNTSTVLKLTDTELTLAEEVLELTFTRVKSK